MPDQTIKCPKCGAEIPLTEALTGQIEQVIKAKYETEAAKKEKEYQAKLKEIQRPCSQSLWTRRLVNLMRINFRLQLRLLYQ